MKNMMYYESFSSPYEGLRDAVVKAAKRHGVDCWRNHPWPEYYDEKRDIPTWFTCLGYWNSEKEQRADMDRILAEANQEFFK